MRACSAGGEDAAADAGGVCRAGALLAPGKPLRLAIERDDATSMIFWGPPGTGKTTLAKIIAQMTQASFIEFSAVMSGIKEIKQVMVEAEKAASFGSRTILFVDEIHRFNKAQQDAFLPYVERGNDPADRRDDGESFVRDQCGAAVAVPGVYAAGADGGAGCCVAAAGAGGCERGLGASGVAADEEALATIASYCERRCAECTECAGRGGEAGGGAWRKS